MVSLGRTKPGRETIRARAQDERLELHRRKPCATESTNDMGREDPASFRADSSLLVRIGNLHTSPGCAQPIASLLPVLSHFHMKTTEQPRV